METIKGLASAFGLDFQDLLLNSPQSNDVVDAEREQSEKEFARHATMRALQEETVSRVAEYWDAKTPGFVIAATALPVVEKWLSDFSIPEVMEAMDVSARQYLVIGPDGCCEKESLERAFQKIPAICFVNRQSKERPEIRDLYMIRGVFRNRIPGYFDNTKATQWLSAALNMGVPVEELRSLANGVRNWTQFRVALEELVQRHRILQEQRGAGPSPGSRAYLSAGSVSPSGATEDGSGLLQVKEQVKGALDYLEDALLVLKRCRARGETWITIDFEDKTYYFGRSPNGWGTPYPIDNSLALDELAGAIEKHFQFVEVS